jgi:hypothetical protein
LNSFCISNAGLHVARYALLVCNLKFTIYTLTLYCLFSGDLCMGTLFPICALHLRKTDESTLSILVNNIVTK